MNIHELSGEIKKTKCECCGKVTICYQEWVITSITRRLIYEQWVCKDCVTEDF